MHRLLIILLFAAAVCGRMSVYYFLAILDEVLNSKKSSPLFHEKPNFFKNCMRVECLIFVTWSFFMFLLGDPTHIHRKPQLKSPAPIKQKCLNMSHICLRSDTIFYQHPTIKTIYLHSTELSQPLSQLRYNIHQNHQ
jgi:hypothetical protein